MWILCHDDLADPDSDDPVARESTRVTAAAVAGGQTSIDPKVIEPWLGPNVLKHNMINMAVGEATIEDALKNYEQASRLVCRIFAVQPRQRRRSAVADDLRQQHETAVGERRTRHSPSGLRREDEGKGGQRRSRMPFDHQGCFGIERVQRRQ